jgi:hypothetical protein
MDAVPDWCVLTGLYALGAVLGVFWGAWRRKGPCQYRGGSEKD